MAVPSSASTAARRNESRGFLGAAQVRQNWSSISVSVPVVEGLVRWSRFHLGPVDGTRPPLAPGLGAGEAVTEHLGTS